MHNLTLAEEAEGVKNIGVVRKVNKIFVGRTRLLLWGDLVSTTYTKI